MLAEEWMMVNLSEVVTHVVWVLVLLKGILIHSFREDTTILWLLSRMTSLFWSCVTFHAKVSARMSPSRAISAWERKPRGPWEGKIFALKLVKIFFQFLLLTASRGYHTVNITVIHCIPYSLITVAAGRCNSRCPFFYCCGLFPDNFSSAW